MSSKTIQKLSNQSGVFLEREKSRNTLNIVSVMGIFCSPKDKFLREYAILKNKNKRHMLNNNKEISSSLSRLFSMIE